MLHRKPTSFTDLAQGWGRLTESFKPKPSAQTRGRNGELLLETKLGVDGRYYGILQEADGYFIKTAAATGLQAPTADEFQYIGGYGNRNLERFASLPKAQHRVHLKLHSLHESAAPKLTTTQPAGGVDDLLQQLDAAPALPAAVAQPEPAVAAPDPALDPLAAAAPGAAPAEPAPAGEPPLPGAAPEAGVEPPLPGAEGDEDDITPDKLLSMVGKLGAAIDKLGPNMTPQLAKSVLNPTITHLSQGINAMSDGDKDEIANRLKDGAQPLDEALAPEQAQLQARNAAGRAAWEQLPATNPVAYANATRQPVQAPLATPITGRGNVPTTYMPDYESPSRQNQAWRQNQAATERQMHQQGWGSNSQGILPGAEAKYQLGKAADLRGRSSQILPEGASEAMLTEAEAAAAEALASYESSPGGGGRLHHQATLEKLQQNVEDAQHALKHFQWMQKMPAHPRESLTENYDPEADALGEDPQDSEYADGFRQFCEIRGYDPYTDEGLAAGVQAWAKKVGGKKSPYNPDIEGVADVMNPYVWAQVKALVPPAFAAQVDQELQSQATQTAPAALTEGLQQLLREFIHEQVSTLHGASEPQ
jgi:hypothetical protein